MDAMSLPARTQNSFADLLMQVGLDFPDIRFEGSGTFCWSADTGTVHYDENADFASWSLLHEIGHMSGKHSDYSSDAMLVRMEVEAWETAKQLGDKYGFSIEEDYVQDCIDSYRDWQHKRSACPACTQTGFEQTSGQYMCFNCQSTWKVTTNRFCRVYRLTAK